MLVGLGGVVRDPMSDERRRADSSGRSSVARIVRYSVRMCHPEVNPLLDSASDVQDYRQRTAGQAPLSDSGENAISRGMLYRFATEKSVGDRTAYEPCDGFRIRCVSTL